MATAQPKHSQPNAFDATVLRDCFHHVLGAGRIIAASGRQKRRDERLVPFQDTEDEALHLASTRFTSLQRSGNKASRTVRRGLNTTTQPMGSTANWARTAWRIRRLMRLRTTALPSARGHVNPKREEHSAAKPLVQNATKNRLEMRAPDWYVDRNSADRTTRFALGRDSGAN